MLITTNKEKVQKENDIYNKYIKKLRGFYYKETSSPTVSHDLALEAITKVLLSIETYNKNIPFERWVYVIAKNNLVDYYRKQGSKKSTFNRCLVDIDLVHEDPAVGANGFDENFTIDIIKVILKKFDTTSQTIFNMHVFEGSSEEEISEATGYKIGTVKHKISFIKRAIRHELEKEGIN